MALNASVQAAFTAQRLAGLALVFNAFTWGLSWWPFRQFQQAGLHPLWVTALAYGAAVALLALRRPRALREVLCTPALWWLVLASGTTNASFNWAVTAGDVVRVVLLFYLMPLWSALLARWLLHERLTLAAGSRVALALAGALMVLWPEAGGWPWPRDLSDVLALVGGFAFALNNVMLRREARRSDDARALAMFAGGVAVAGGLALALGLAPLPLGGMPPTTGVALAALALWFLASNIALQYGAARLTAHATSLIMLTEVLFASVSALALGAADPGIRVWLGGAMILSAALWAAAPASKTVDD